MTSSETSSESSSARLRLVDCPRGTRGADGNQIEGVRRDRYVNQMNNDLLYNCMDVFRKSNGREAGPKAVLFVSRLPILVIF